MYKDGETAIARILALVERCPDSLKEKCFEVLLTAYANAQVGMPTGSRLQAPVAGQPLPERTTALRVPEEIKSRFLSMARRLEASPERMAELFDFNADPFTYHALSVPGNSKADKTRNAALLVAAKAYLTNGAWTADWKEVKALCVDQACYDRGNMGTFLKKGPLFKVSSAADNIALSSKGIAEAEKVLASLVEPREE